MERVLVENAVPLLMKFGSEVHLKELQAGSLYMRPLQYYIDREKATGDEKVGDQYEGQMMLCDARISLYTVDTKQFVTSFDAPNVSFGMGHQTNPVFCMTMMDYRNYSSQELNGEQLRVRYDFTEAQRQKMQEFGDDVLIIINVGEFVRRVQAGFCAKNIAVINGPVRYYGYNSVEYVQEVLADDNQMAFWKRKKYDYQQEYRFLALTDVDTSFTVDIGDISDITHLMKSKDLFNTSLEMNYLVDIEREK